MDFTVTLQFQFPSWDEKEGIEFQVSAQTKRDAVTKAKRMSERDGHTPCVGKGRVTFTASPVEAASVMTQGDWKELGWQL